MKTTNPFRNTIKKYLIIFLKTIFPDLVLTREESIKTISILQAKLNNERKEVLIWRNRCSDLENLYMDQLSTMQKAARSGKYPGLGWRAFGVLD